MSGAFVVFAFISVILGVIVLLITQAVYATIPDDSEIAKKIIADFAKMNGCGDNPDCKNSVQKDLSLLEWYQKADSAKATGQLFGVLLIAIPAPLGILVAVKQ